MNKPADTTESRVTEEHGPDRPPNPSGPLDPPGPPNPQHPLDQSDVRICIACGYSLRGLGAEPRCPECGLLNVTQAFREQVWKAIDRGGWLISAPQSFFQKRPPGWWWSLDRNGDVRRSAVRAFDASLITALIILGIGTAAGSFCEMHTIDYVYSNLSKPLQVVMPAGRLVSVTTTFGLDFEIHNSVMKERKGTGPGQPLLHTTASTSSKKWAFQPTLPAFTLASLALIWTLATWAGPATVGLWTQIRKGLPAFARAPRTIIAASGYESHRLLYLAPLVAAAFVADAAMRYNNTDRQTYYSVITAFAATALVFSAAGWIGPLRTDYTHQLVRSWFHAARILVMYAVILPVVVLIIAACIALLALRFSIF